MAPSARRALFPGSFDPPTRGHREVLRQACAAFEEVLVGLAVNPEKRGFLSPEDRLRLLACMVRPFANARVVAFEGLTAEFAMRERVDVLVRGLRDERDLAYEKELARGNEILGAGLGTVFFLATGPYELVSSRLVREIARLAGFQAALPFLPEELHAEFASLSRGYREKGGDR